MIACPANRLFLLKTWSHPLIIQGLILCLLCIICVKSVTVQYYAANYAGWLGLPQGLRGRVHLQ